MQRTYPAEDVIVAGQVRLARPTAVDAASREVDVVCKTHDENDRV